MKKIFVILSLLALSGFAAVSVDMIQGEATTTAASTTITPATTFPDTTVTIDTTASLNSYVYTDLDDLIDQIYQDVYDQIYQEIYDELSASIGTELYEEIYAQVLANLEAIIFSGNVEVYIDAFQLKIDAVATLADASVVGVSTYLGNDGVSLGSGVVYRYDAVNDEYYLITNEHVVEGGDNYKVVFADMTKVVAQLLGSDSEVDIAVLKFSGADLPYEIAVSPLGDSDLVAKGSVVLAVGHPRGYDFYGSITMGVVAGLDRDVAGDGYVGYIQHDASINSGNSGGPLYNLDGEVIGINVSKFASTEIEGMGFAIPINMVKEVIAAVEAGTMLGETVKPRLGALLLDIAALVSDGTIAVDGLIIDNTLNLDDVILTLPTDVTLGLLVKAVHSAGTLYGTGIAIGDLITNVGGEPISSLEAFYTFFYANYEFGDIVSIQYYDLDAMTAIYALNVTTVDVTLK